MKKYLKEWNLFYVHRYNVLMDILGEQGVVELIQSYMDDLDVFPDLEDTKVFALWYCKKYNFEHAFDIELKRPLLINHN